jgi:DNA-binding GntR family transcriptional regulator
MFEKLPVRPDYVEQTYRVVADAISEGKLAPGTRITQEEIAEQLQISRQPVLQALRLLKKDGLIEDAAGRGVQVTALNVDFIEKLYEVRGALDSLAARLAARRSQTLDPQLIIDGRKASAGTDVKAMIDADIAFHRAIYDASGNPLIEKSANSHWVHLRRVMGAVLQHAGQRASIWDEHEAVARAIAKGDEALAMQLSETHSTNARHGLRERLSEVIQRGETAQPV